MTAITTPNNFGANHPQVGLDAYNITESDTLVQPFFALYIGTGGTVVITTFSGNVATFTSVPSGVTLWVTGNKLMTTSDASNIVALV